MYEKKEKTKICVLCKTLNLQIHLKSSRFVVWYILTAESNTEVYYITYNIYLFLYILFSRFVIKMIINSVYHES